MDPNFEVDPCHVDIIDTSWGQIRNVQSIVQDQIYRESTEIRVEDAERKRSREFKVNLIVAHNNYLQDYLSFKELINTNYRAL